MEIQLTNRQILNAKKHLQLLMQSIDLDIDSKKLLFENMNRINRQLLSIESQRNMIEAKIFENQLEVTTEEKIKRFETFLNQDSGIELKIKIPDSIFYNATVADLMALLPFTE